MARSKHRKDHNKAIALRRTMKALEEAARPPTPVKVGKNKFKVLGDGPDRPTTPEEIAALPEVQVSGTAGHLLPGEVVHVHDSAGRPFYARVAKPLRGHARLLTTIDDAAEFPPHLVKELQEGSSALDLMVKATVDGQEVPAQLTPTGRVVLDEAPPEGSHVLIGIDPAVPGSERTVLLETDYAEVEQRLAAHYGLSLESLQGRRAGMSVKITPEQERAIREGKFLGVSMGFTHDGVPEVQGLNPPPLAGISGPYHLEMAISEGPDGKPRFEEISLCPGPDPSGITDLKDPE